MIEEETAKEVSARPQALGGTVVRVTIRVKPGSSRVRVGPERDGALLVAVTARAVDGRATEAALSALAEALGLRRREVTLITGATSRTKVVEVNSARGSDPVVAQRLDQLRTTCGP